MSNFPLLLFLFMFTIASHYDLKEAISQDKQCEISWDIPSLEERLDLVDSRTVVPRAKPSKL